MSLGPGMPRACSMQPRRGDEPIGEPTTPFEAYWMMLMETRRLRPASKR